MPTRKKSALKKHGPASKEVAGLDFTALVDGIRQIHEQSAAVVNRVVNSALTLRNWAFGAYIHHYELHGADRAVYGDGLLARLADRLASEGLLRTDERELRRYRAFYSVYPSIRETLSPEFKLSLPWPLEIRETASPEFGHRGGVSILETLSPESGAPVGNLLAQLSYSHLDLLVSIDDPLKRAFYEIECIRGNWSVRELKRQIVTLYFERSGLSKDKEKLAAMVRKGAEPAEPKLAIRDPYIFEFLGLRAKDAVAESDLEAALVEHLREFLLELGHGFCLEAQQKSMVIGSQRGFVDLVFYHRILKCHVLVELKVDEFRHEHVGQLNTYVTWYRKHVMSEGDNPPVGILLCTEKDQTLVEYATASMDNRLFVSKYAVELPTKAELVKFVQRQYREMTGTAAPRRRAK